MAAEPEMFECTFCGGQHPQDPDKTFLGAPLRTCPNLPKGWTYIGDRIMRTDDDGNLIEDGE